MKLHSAVLAIVGAMALTGCASYAPQPLDRTPDLASSAPAPQGMKHGAYAIHDIDRLTLANNPDLRAARARLGVARAQILEAGVLPNPQIGLSYPFYAGGGPGVNAFSAGLSQDLRSIVLRPAKVEAAAAAAAEIDASLYWQEWQTLGKARMLFVDIVSGERAEKVIGRTRKLLEARLDHASKAIDQGNGTLATLSPDLAAASEIQKLGDDLQRVQLARRHQLNALLGLSPDVSLPLAGGSEPPPLDAQRVRDGLASLADRRPDLIALQFGYQSEEAKLRQAVLAQFPNVSVGVIGGNDSNGIYSVGPQITLDLPVFDRNQGVIARESATREALHAEFDARLKAAASEVGALLAEQALAQRQLAELAPRLKRAETIAAQSETAYRQNLLDERAYVDTQLAQLTIERQKIELQQALLEGRASLATLTGADLPPVTINAGQQRADTSGQVAARF
ncbi:TolC family protein [Rhodoblastus sp.]|uniref:TolC family protein n=1 Tax=Rhodoblastus sp. TaxID=1962975 RepID=UPI002616A62D|nr:TolC family protein [Rhodoblastus sp.]